MTPEFFDMTSLSNIFDLFLLLILVTGPSFMSISSLVLELQQFSFITDWPEIWKSEIPPSEFCPRSGDWGKWGIPNLARMSLLKFYWMLQNVRVTTFTVSELLKENKQGVPPPLQICNSPRIKPIRSHLSKILLRGLMTSQYIFNTFFTELFLSGFKNRPDAYLGFP